jgi:CBS-domain-containing membrane protein
MRIEQIMTKDVDSCGPDDHLDRAAQIMWERDCGVVPVTTPERRVVGVVTDRDACMASYTRGQRLDQIRIGDVMSTQICACRPEDDPGRAEELMKRAQIHRLPVVDAANQLLGMVSLADLARRAKSTGAGAKSDPQLTPAAIGETLAAISQPRVRAVVAAA